VATISRMISRNPDRESQASIQKRQAEQKVLIEHQVALYEISQLKNFKCPCCDASLKSLEEVDLVVKNKCIFCKSDKIQKEDYCVKWVYGCPDGHKGFLAPGSCPELIDDVAGKKKECKKPLEKVEVSFEAIIYKYVCPECKETSDKPGKCSKCNKDLAKIKTCAKSGVFPHINEKEWEKEQKAKREEAKK
jgi:hypothetical protein